MRAVFSRSRSVFCFFSPSFSSRLRSASFVFRNAPSGFVIRLTSTSASSLCGSASAAVAVTTASTAARSVVSARATAGALPPGSCFPRSTRCFA